MAEEEQSILEQVLGPGAGVYRITGEGQQAGSVFDFNELSPSQQNQLFNELAFQDMALENALAIGAAKEAGLDAGGPFGAPLGFASANAPYITPSILPGGLPTSQAPVIPTIAGTGETYLDPEKFGALLAAAEYAQNNNMSTEEVIELVQAGEISIPGVDIGGYPDIYDYLYETASAKDNYFIVGPGGETTSGAGQILPGSGEYVLGTGRDFAPYATFTELATAKYELDMAIELLNQNYQMLNVGSKDEAFTALSASKDLVQQKINEYKALGGDLDPSIAELAAKGLITVGAAPNLGTTGGGDALPGFNQIVWNIPSIIAGQPVFTGQWSDAGSNLPIKFGEVDNTIIAGTTGIPALDDAITDLMGGDTTGRQIITREDADTDPNSIEAQAKAASDRSGLILNTAAAGADAVNITADDGAATLTTDDDDKTVVTTDGGAATLTTDDDDATKTTTTTTTTTDDASVVGSTDPLVGGLTTDQIATIGAAEVNDTTKTTTTGGDGTLTVDAGDAIGPVPDASVVGSTDPLVGGLTTDQIATIGAAEVNEPEAIEFTPTDTKTVTDRTAPTLEFTPGEQQEVTTTLNDAVSALLASDTTSSQTFQDALETVLDAVAVEKITGEPVLSSALQGRSTFETGTLGEASGALKGQTTETNLLGAGEASGTLKGSEVKYVGGEPVLEGVLKSGEPVLKTTLKGSGGSSGSSGITLPSGGFRGVREEPGDLVNIDYLYDFDKGLDQPFITTSEDEEMKNLYMYAEGGDVDNQDAVDMVTRRPGEYGRTYFDYATPSGFARTGKALGGGALNPNAIQIPEYTYTRTLKPEFSGAGTTPAGTTTPADTTTTLAGTLGASGLSDFLGSLQGIFGGSGGTTITQPGITTSGDQSLPGAESTFTLNNTTTTTQDLASDPVSQYLASLGYGLTKQPVTAENIQKTLNEGYSLADIAGAFGTTTDILNQILNPTSTTTTTPIDASYTYTPGESTSDVVNTVIQNELNNYLQTLGYGLTKQPVTAENIQKTLNQGFSLEDIAGAFGTTESILNNILNPTSTVTTDIDATSTYVAGDPTSDTQTTVADTEINKYLQTLGYNATSAQPVTAENIQSTLDEGYSLGDIADAFGTTEAILNRILNPTTTNTTGAASSSTYTAGTENTTTVDIENAVRDYLTENREFVIGTPRKVTKDDLIALREQGNFTVEQIAAGLGTTKEAVQAILDYEYAAGGQVLDAVDLATGGMAQGQGYYLGGPTDGMADLIPATIDGTQPAALSDGEFVIPADVVSHLGNGNSDAGAEQLYSMMDRVRTERTGTTKQGPEIDPMQMMPA